MEPEKTRRGYAKRGGVPMDTASIRIPIATWDALSELAEKTGNSRNKEIALACEKHIKAAKRRQA